MLVMDLLLMPSYVSQTGNMGLALNIMRNILFAAFSFPAALPNKLVG